ncbi:MAG: gamma-glutamylcyclotransferase [Acidobacteria bacterium]|nr:gamma-glutamylcyclotransferase [Acidobacteriota bacterium]
MAIGIFAYGSLIDEPGNEIAAALDRTIRGVRTPFSVEYARSSNKRCGAPSLIPVESGGRQVDAAVLALRENVSEQEATDMLYRREIGRVGKPEIQYRPNPARASQVYVERLTNVAGMDVVIYTRIEANILPLTEGELARRAIESAKRKCGASKQDGISYLMAAKRNGIETPLTRAYEEKILQFTGTQNLAAAWLTARKEAT